MVHSTDGLLHICGVVSCHRRLSACGRGETEWLDLCTVECKRVMWYPH